MRVWDTIRLLGRIGLISMTLRDLGSLGPFGGWRSLGPDWCTLVQVIMVEIRRMRSIWMPIHLIIEVTTALISKASIIITKAKKIEYKSNNITMKIMVALTLEIKDMKNRNSVTTITQVLKDSKIIITNRKKLCYNCLIEVR